jgi:hypothetical protein
LVHDSFYKLNIQGDIYHGQLKMNDKEGIIKLQHKNNVFIFNPDYHIVKTTIKAFEDKYKH